MAAFEDNNPFASPSSPSSSRANSYAPFGSFPGPYSPTTPASTSNPLHAAHASFDSTNRPMTSSSEDAPAYQFQATNSDFSDPRPGTPGESGMETPGAGGAGGAGGGTPGTRETDGEMCCKIDEVFVRNPEMRIVISDAGKASDGGANFIAYTIQVGVGSFSLVEFIPFAQGDVLPAYPKWIHLFIYLSSLISLPISLPLHLFLHLFLHILHLFHPLCLTSLRSIPLLSQYLLSHENTILPPMHGNS
jgi:hypothetical protein